MNGWTVALITAALIIASAFFVIVEFALGGSSAPARGGGRHQRLRARGPARKSTS